MHEPPGFSSTGGLHFAALQTFGAAGNVIREVERLSQDLAHSAERLEELHDLELNLTVFDVEEHGKHDPVALVFQLYRPLADDVEEWLKLQEEPTALDPLAARPRSPPLGQPRVFFPPRRGASSFVSSYHCLPPGRVAGQVPLPS